MKTIENPSQDLINLYSEILKLEKRGKKVTEFGSILNQRKQIIQDHINNLKAYPPETSITKHNLFTEQLNECVRVRIQLKKSWDKLKIQEESVSIRAEKMENLISDFPSLKTEQKLKIESLVFELEQIVSEESQILTKREGIMKNEEMLISESEKLFGIDKIK